MAIPCRAEKKKIVSENLRHAGSYLVLLDRDALGCFHNKEFLLHFI